MLAVECFIACLLFTIIMVGGVLWKREAFFHEYAPDVQKRFLKLHPEFVPKEPKKNTGALILAKVAMSLLFIIILTTLIYFAGARSFLTGTIYAYIIWFIVNWYDVFVLDIGIFAHWKKVRLAGTEDMDAAYCSNVRKHVLDGFIGMGIGIPVACACGWALTLLV